jgi:hypothetical protein
MSQLGFSQPMVEVNHAPHRDHAMLYCSVVLVVASKFCLDSLV